jgi:nucleoside-diphosphate-sugar epimerase
MTKNTTREKILVIGALGQIGQELIESLRENYGQDQVIASDLRPAERVDMPAYVSLDVLDKAALYRFIESENITTIYNLAAILSARGEQHPAKAWEVNMGSLFNTLEATRETSVNKLFWPSSIAVFGPHSPAQHTPQHTIMDPNTVYGISKLAGERWCEYYAERYGADIRSLRYPGLIGYKAIPGGGTTDYAVDIFHQAIQHGTYTAYLSPATHLPMMYMPDAIRATLQLMDAPSDRIRIRSAYNLAGFSVSPEQLAEAIRAHLPQFSCDYAPDFRQQIADSWPDSIDDTEARQDWGWQPEFDLKGMVADMLMHIHQKYPSKMAEEAG